MTGLGRALGETGSSARLVWDDANLRRVNLSLLGSSIGDGAYTTALAVYAFQWGGAGALGAYVAVKLALKALSVPFLVALAERLPRKTVLVGLDAVRAVLVTVVALLVLAGAPPLLVLVVAGATGIIGAPFRPVSAALTPSLVSSPRELTAANGVGSTVESLAFFVGPALGGLLLGLTGVPAVFLLDAVTFVWSAVLVLGLRPRAVGSGAPDRSGSADVPGFGEPPESAPGFVVEALAGFRVVGSDRRLLLVVGLTCLQTFVVGAATVFTVVVAVRLVDLGDPGVGYLNALLGVGSVIGGLVALGRAGRATLATDFGSGVLLWALPPLVVGLLPYPWVAFAAFLVLGVASPLVAVNLMTLLQRLAPGTVLGRVLGALESATLAAMALGALATPLLIGALGPAWGLVALVVPLAVVAALCFPALRRLDHALRPPALLGLVRSQPLFAGLSPATQESLATRLRRAEAPAGTHVIEAGAAGDTFYLVESGRLDAVRGAEHLSAMVAGDCFGEIALLRDVPRTATVVAVEDSVLQTLDRTDFLAAVGADPETAARADSLVLGRLSR